MDGAALLEEIRRRLDALPVLTPDERARIMAGLERSDEAKRRAALRDVETAERRLENDGPRIAALCTKALAKAQGAFEGLKRACLRDGAARRETADRSNETDPDDLLSRL